MLQKLKARLNEYIHIAPLAVLRIAFGAILFISIVRFMMKGWIADFYIIPRFHFTFYGFEWIKPLGSPGMYLLFGIMAITSLLIMLGLFYRISSILFFFSFTYTELIDKTYYLNHYYFISIMTFLMMLVPAHRYFSLDVLRKPSLKISHVPGWTILIFKLQLTLVYLFAGISKLNYDWLINAMPLKIWLPANYHLPLIGPLLTEQWVAYFFSWFGAAFDLSIAFFMLSGRTRKYAYFVLVLFHIFTAWFFKIGMFPYIMIFVTLIFFSENFHRNLIGKIIHLLKKAEDKPEIFKNFILSPLKSKIMYSLLIVYFFLQALLPFRYILYPGELFWTEEGYRFSWRVMLMEKGGTAFFYVQDPDTGKKMEIANSQFLSPMQEKMLTTQPDMILQFAHFLDEEFRKKGVKDPIVTVEDYVTLNGSGSRLFIDKTVDLSKEQEGFAHKTWILPFNKTN
jgi:uncharacterized membrane protein YphA (DoxX/SURF4 family)